MRIVNKHIGIPTATLRRLLKFAAKGIDDTGIQVYVTEIRGVGRVNGMAYGQSESIDARRRLGLSCNPTGIRYLITLQFPLYPVNYPSDTVNSYKLKRLDAKWPNGIPFDGWQDAVVHIAAHEFRHIWQFRKPGNTLFRRNLSASEYDAEKYSYNKLNKWREATNRVPVEAIKQPNPFSGSVTTNSPERSKSSLHLTLIGYWATIARVLVLQTAKAK